MLTPHALWSGKGFALLKVLLMEQHALVSLVRTDLEAAAHHISGLIGVLQRFPTLMRDFVPSARMLQGGWKFDYQFAACRGGTVPFGTAAAAG